MMTNAFAAISQYWGPLNVVNPAIATGRVFAFLKVLERAIRNSFHAKTKEKRKATAIPGTAMGMTI